ATERLGGDAQALAGYVKALARAFNESLGNYGGPPRSIAVAIVIKPGNQSRLWYAPEPAADPALDAIYPKVAPALASQKPPQVRGPFGLAINFSIAGGKPANAKRLPVPPEWVAVPKARNSTMNVEEIWAVVWPDATPEAKPQEVKPAPVVETKPREVEPAPVVVPKAPAARTPEPKPARAAPTVQAKPVEVKAPEPAKPSGPCGFQPVMTDEDLARCR